MLKGEEAQFEEEKKKMKLRINREREKKVFLTFLQGSITRREENEKKKKVFVSSRGSHHTHLRAVLFRREPDRWK